MVRTHLQGAHASTTRASPTAQPLSIHSTPALQTREPRTRTLLSGPAGQGQLTWANRAAIPQGSATCLWSHVHLCQAVFMRFWGVAVSAQTATRMFTKAHCTKEHPNTCFSFSGTLAGIGVWGWKPQTPPVSLLLFPRQL